MPRLPQPGGDSGTWGDVLNQFLEVAHSTDGTLKANSVAGSHVQNGSITEAKLSSAVQTKLNSAGGTLADGSVTTVKLADGAVTDAKVTSVSQGKVTGLSTALDAKYTLPAGGVPEADLSSAVQTKLNAGSASTLNDLTDVNTGGVVDGQALVWQGTQWGPATISGGGGSTDHGALTGLADDDHPQYLNNTRGDARYYTKTQLDTALTGKADSAHSHAAADITSGTITPARLGSGTADGTTYLRGDGTLATVSAGGATNLDALSDVTVASPSSGQVLAYNGTSWVNQAAPSGGGGGTFSIVNQSSNYTANSYEFVICDASAGRVDITLPAAAAGAWVRVKKADSTANAVLVLGGSGATINGSTSHSINIATASQDIMCDGTNWHLI